MKVEAARNGAGIVLRTILKILKTFAGLLHHLKYIHDPLYRGVTVRRTTPMILKSGAVWDESKQLFTNIDPKGKIKVKDLKYQFSSGAEVAFSHFERADNTKDW